MLLARYAEARALCEQAIEVARAVGARREEGYALNPLGGALSGLGEPEAADANLEQGLAIAEAVGSIDDSRRGYGNLVAVLGLGSRLERAAEVGRAGVARLEALGYASGTPATRPDGTAVCSSRRHSHAMSTAARRRRRRFQRPRPRGSLGSLLGWWRRPRL